MSRKTLLVLCGTAVLICGLLFAADIVPTDIQQPGTQPQEISNLESPDKCDNCHGGYNELVEPAFNWRGSMMANAGRDPIFWATLAVAEQDFDGAGDLCIRCHSTAGWLAGRSTPTDGSGLAASDGDGVECDFCHKMTNPDNSEHLGVMNGSFIANDGGNPPVGYYGSGMASMWGGSEKLGPYADTVARHRFMQSNFHRSQDFCGTCHDVSNPAVGDLSHNYGAQPSADPVTASGVPGSPVEIKAAFNNFPFMYGIVERTFSEYKSGLLSQTLVLDYENFPPELKDGAIRVAYESAIIAGTDGNYGDGMDRYFTCQTCHLRPVDGVGCNKKGAPIRKDLPLHDMTGGNYWMADAIQYLDPLGKLRLGGGLTATQIAALNAGVTRAKKQLNEAASLSASYTGTTLDVEIVNLTGHKLISGYPEGRRMWLNIKWYDGSNPPVLIREDGEYRQIGVTVQNPAGGNSQVESLLDPYDPNTKVYEAHYGMTKEWAEQLISLGYPTDLALSYDRYTGDVDFTLGELAAEPTGTEHETFHFVLNNTVVKDNRIPPYGMAYEEARKRNALPVPESQYLGAGGVYDHFDVVHVTPPGTWDPSTGYVEVYLKYQPTSWEYIQFLWLANNEQSSFLVDEGVNLLEAWLNTGMAAPYVMASTTWGTAPTPATPEMYTDDLTTFRGGKRGQVIESTIFKTQDNFLLDAHVVDEDLTELTGAQVFVEVQDSGGNTVVSLQGFSDDTGIAQLQWKIPRRQAPGNYTVFITDIVKNGYLFIQGVGVDQIEFTIQ
jgi:hypothetical protein